MYARRLRSGSVVPLVAAAAPTLGHVVLRAMSSLGQLKTGTTLAAATNRAEAGARAVETQAADGWEVNGD